MIPFGLFTVALALAAAILPAGCSQRPSDPNPRAATQPSTGSATTQTRPSASQANSATTRRGLVPYQYLQLHMGVKARLMIYAADEDSATEAARAAFRRIVELEDISSDYRRDSELNRLCRRAGGPPVPVSPELFTLLQRSNEVARLSVGAFDPTISPLVRLWRTARETKRLPTTQAIAEARTLVGHDKLRLNPVERTAQLLVTGMQLDMGGIAKGYAGDLAIATLRKLGFPHSLFEAGGDIVLGDPPPGEEGWRIEVVSAGPHDPPRVVTLSNCAISTSGDTMQFVEIGGKRYSHIVDARTGIGLTNRVAVTIIGPDGLTTDSLSTALSTLR